MKDGKRDKAWDKSGPVTASKRRNKVMAFTVTDETLKRTQDSLEREI